MGLVINTNISSLVAQRSMSLSTTALNKSMEKLSSGLRINKASDDAAGLTISEKMKSQYRGADVGMANAQDAINMLQVAEGDLGIIQDNLQRVRELTVQAANGTNGTDELAAIEAEVTQRLDEINRVAAASDYNGIKLLDGTAGTVNSQVGANTGDTIDISAGFADAQTTLAAAGNYATPGDANAFLASLDTEIQNISSQRSTIGALQNRLESATESQSVRSTNLKAADSRIRDVDVAKESANLMKNQILQQASVSLLAQANQSPGLALSLI